MAAAFMEVDGQQLTHTLQSEPVVLKTKGKESQQDLGCESSLNHHGVCAICLNNILLQETALVKGCEHAYCVTCILRWASYKKEPTCPQCKHPFDSLHIHRSLDGSVVDYLCEESVCLLLRASWFKPLIFEEQKVVNEDMDDFDLYDEDDEDEALEEAYLGRSSTLRIGNRRWGDNGYVRGGRQEARPVVHQPNIQEPGAGSSRHGSTRHDPTRHDSTRQKLIKKAADEIAAQRAQRALKREAANKAAVDAAAAKHRQRLIKLGKTLCQGPSSG